MATFTYNGVSFSMIHVLTYSQEAIYDPTGVDYLYTKVSIQIQAIMSVDPTAPGTKFVAPSTATDGSVAQSVVNIRSALRTPRQRLQFADGATLVDSFGSAFSGPGGPKSQFDVKDGPFPHVLAITRFDGSSSYWVSFTIETYILECPGSSINILSHRWKEQIDIDRLFVMGYKRSGTLIVALTPTGANADVIGRPATFVPLRNGFRREHSQYALSEDGLILTYTIEDRQLYRMIPFPALEAKGSRTESYGTNLTTKIRSVHISLTGPPDAKQLDLINLAVYLGLQQVYFPAAAGVINNTSLTLGLWENSVEFSIQCQLVPTTTLYSSVAPMTSKKFSAKLYTEKDARMPLPTIYGSASTNANAYSPQAAAQVQLLSAVLGIPCRPIQQLGSIKGPQANAAVNLFNAAVQAVQAALNAQNGTVQGLSAADFQNVDPPLLFATDVGIFTDYMLRTYYGDEENILQLPNATPAGGSPAASIVQWANETQSVIVEWSASKVNAWPTVPSRKSKDQNLVYKKGWRSPTSAVIRGDGETTQYTITGKYTYAVIDPTKLVMSSGLMPWIDNKSGAITTTVPDSTFVDTIMSPATAGSGTTGGTPAISISQGTINNIK